MIATLAAATLLAKTQTVTVFRELAAKPGRWLQKPTTLAAQHGKVVLLDFWDYTCVNCIRTFPYLREWYRRYHNKGFEIIGIHTPEFDFEHDPAKVEAAAKRFGFTWPILNDPQREDWWEYGVFAWPTKIVLDGNGHQVLFRYGEGSYGLFEKTIQDELRKLHPGIHLPALMEPVRDTDKPGAVCRPKTAEIYTSIKGLPKHQLCYQPNQIGTTVKFAYPPKRESGIVYLSGTWSPQKHFLQAQGAGSNLKLIYMAKELNAVLTPTAPVRIAIYQDGKPLDRKDFGDDVHLVNGVPTLVAKESRMYSILKNHEWANRELELRVLDPGLQIYEFSFSTDCAPSKK